MDRVWHHFEEWECVRAGMYVPMEPSEERVARAVSVLGVAHECDRAMRQVAERWPVSVAQVFSDTARNRRAWLGRACVCEATGLPEAVTRVAWYMLTLLQQDTANAIADAVIGEWEVAYRMEQSCQRDIWGRTF